MRFEFATSTRIIFGCGTLNEVAPLAEKMGSQAFIVTGKSDKRAEPLLELLTNLKTGYHTFNVSREPTTAIVRNAAEDARWTGCDLVIGMGGGSVIDTGKAVAALLTNSGDLFDYLEVVGKGMPLQAPSAPFIAIPTTAGTGAEVTRNAVLESKDHRVKVSMRSPLMFPKLAVVDPELTKKMPPAVTAATGMDALTQLLEAYVTSMSNPLTDSICREGLGRAAVSIETAYEDGGNMAAREGMALAALFGGLALANAKLGAVHGLAASLGSMFSIPHGVVCARLLPFVMEANVIALKARRPAAAALSRYDEAAMIITGDRSACADDGIKWVGHLCNTLKIPALMNFGLEERVFPALVETARNSSSMQGNPVALTDEELMDILKKSI